MLKEELSSSGFYDIVWLKRKQIPIFSFAQNAGTIFSVAVFKPGGPTFEEMFVDCDKVDFVGLAKYYFPVVPENVTPEMINDLLAGKQIHIPSYSTAAMGAAFVVEELLKALIIKKGYQLYVPDIYLVDAKNLKIIRKENSILINE